MVSIPAGSDIQRFFSWWGQELYGLLPGGTSNGETAQARTVIGVEPDGLRLIEAAGGKPAGLPAPEGTVPVPAMLAYLASLARNKRAAGTIGLRLSNSACFVRRLELPAIARRDFGRLLAIDLERSTPFKSKDVLTAHLVDDAPSAKGLLKVRHLIIKRKAVEGLKSEIEALGLKVTRVECLQDNGITVFPVNFLSPEAEAAPQPGSSSIKTKGLALAAAALAASAVYLYVDRHEQALQTLLEQTSKLKAKTLEQKDALAKSKSAFAEIANYQKLRSESVPKVVVLEELTRILPETAYVTDLKIDGTTIDISGLAASAAALVPLLEHSKIFVDATSTASLMFDPREDKERFAIRTRIRSAAVPATAEAEVAKPTEPTP